MSQKKGIGTFLLIAYYVLKIAALIFFQEPPDDPRLPDPKPDDATTPPVPDGWKPKKDGLFKRLFRKLKRK
jgi:hypothetical protein